MPLRIKAKIAEALKEENIQQELSKAGDRLGDSPPKMLNRLLQFLELSIEGQSWSEFFGWGMEMALFTWVGAPGKKKQELLPSVKPKVLIFKDGWKNPLDENFAIPTRGEAYEAQQKIKELLNQFMRHKQVEVKIGEMAIAFLREPQKQKVIHNLRIYQDRFVEMFTLQFGFLLIEAGEYLRTCQAKNCGKNFVAHRPKQVFCGARCQSRIAMKRHREILAQKQKVKRKGQPSKGKAKK